MALPNRCETVAKSCPEGQVHRLTHSHPHAVTHMQSPTHYAQLTTQNQQELVAEEDSKCMIVMWYLLWSICKGNVKTTRKTTEH